MVPKLCFDGGPSAGKTSGLAHLVGNLSKRGFYPLVVPEAATLLMTGNLSPQVWATRDFQSTIIATTRELENVFMRAAQSRLDLNPVLLCDRGRASSRAYTDEATYLDALRDNDIISHVEARDGYTGVFHLVTAADGAEKFYTTANNKVRHETLDEARELDRRTRAAWIGAPHWREIDNSTDFEGKLARLDREVCATLGIPIPLEIERKFLCEPVDPTMLPREAQHIEIEQIYLLNRDPNLVSRIRKRGQYGSYMYFRTDKRFISPGVNTETEKLITAAEYETCLALRNPHKNTLRKVRTCFPYDRQYFELDAIPLRSEITVNLLEIELTEENQGIRIPSFINVIKEVTDDPAYTNVKLAELA